MKRFIQSAITRFKKIPVPVRIGVGVGVAVLLYVGTFVIPTNIPLSYANKESCVGWLTIAPELQHQRAGKESFTFEARDVVRVFNVPVFGQSVCVTPVNAPKEGLAKTSLAPLGLPIFSKTFGVNTPPPPTAQVGNLKGKEISAVKPLMIPLSEKDAIHTYQLRQANKTTDCEAVDNGVSCDISKLGLSPSTPYDIALDRGYDKDKTTQIETLSVRTLTAVQLVDASIKNDAVVYDKPADMRFVFDRALDSAEATLQRVDGDDKSVIPVVASVDGVTAVVAPKQSLARNATYQMTLKQVNGKDGGSLAAPVVTTFKLSGGPKVTNVSIGGGLVPQNARIVVTFDQTIKADADIAKFARTTGVESSVTSASDNSLAFNLTSAGQCAAFSVVVDKGMPSGSNDEVSSEPWKFDSRIICGSSSVIGSSVKGRAIVAYTFGSGSSTILFTGGMHGSEPSGTTTMQAWVTYLQTNGYKIPADKKVVIVPNTNPDGIASGSRNNANNVNIDRNFPASNWRPDIDTASGNLPTGGGSAPGSEPETKALITLTRQLNPRLEVSFHAQGSLVGANQVGDSSAIATMYARMVGYGTMIGNAEEVMGYGITGEYEDWMGQERGTPAILIELPRSSGNYFNSQLNALMKLLTV